MNEKPRQGRWNTVATIPDSQGENEQVKSNTGVTVIQNITVTDPDPFHLARRASFAAQAAM